MTDLAGAGARALLIGTASYTGPALPPLPSVARSLTALAAALREHCGLDGSRLQVLADPPDARTMAEAVAGQAQRADSVLLIYYLGHGLLGPRGELYLAASSTGTLTPGLAAHQALPFSAIAEALSGCRASSVVVVLDCCFSGRAGLALPPGEPSFTLPAAHGIYLLASAERLALAPENTEFTLFTGAFIDLLVNGIPRGPRLLTLDAAYDQLFRALRAAGGPLPRRQAGDRSGALVLTVNRAQPEPPPDGEPEDTPAPCPYLGLSAFGVDDAHLFRGREQLTGELAAAAAEALGSSQPLVLVGPSGSGKTSLLHAGLLARLRAGAPELPGSAGWPWLTLTPGDHPLQALAARLAPAGTRPAELLRRDPEHAAGLMAGLLDRHPAATGVPVPRRLVVVVDQLEQLFVLGAGPAERAAFLAALWSLARPPEGTGCQALVVLALRADFYGRATEHPGLLAALTGSQFLVGPMTPAELRAAIEEPAQATGVRLDDGLADVILHELGAVDATGPGPGVLPLLSHTLWATWRMRSGSRLTMADYRAVGGVAQAIATTADATYRELTPDEQTAARRLLPQLVRVHDEAPDTVRPQDRQSLLTSLPGQDAADSAINRLADARLLTVDRDTVRISHEALLRSWPLLSGWVDADRDWLRTSQQLADDARGWRQSGQDRSLLYRGGRLAQVRERAAGAGRDRELPPDAAAFLAASVQQERRLSRLRTGVITALSVLLVLAVASAGTAAVFQRQAVGQRNQALTRLIAAEADQLRLTDPSLATQLSLAAYQLDPAAGTGALLASQGSYGAYDDHEPALDIAQRADGRVLAISTGTGLRLWDTRGRRLAAIGPLDTGPVVIGSARRLLIAGVGPITKQSSQQANPDTSLAAGCDQVRLWSTADPAHPRQLASLPMGTADVDALALSPDERVLAAGLSNGVLRVWDLADPQHPRALPSLPGPGKQVFSLVFAPHGRLLAGTGADGKVRLWDLADAAHGRLLAQVPGLAGSAQFTSAGPAIRHLVAFSSSGRLLAAGYGQSIPRIWDVSDPARPHPVTPATVGYSSYCEAPMGLAFTTHTSGLLVSCSDELETWAYDPRERPGQRLQEMTALGSDYQAGGQILVQPGRPRVLNASPDGVRVWNLSDPAAPGALASFPASTGLAPGQTSFSVTGRPLLADTGDISAIRLWDASNPRDPRNLAVYSAVYPSATGAEVNALAGATALSYDGKLLAASEVRNGRPAVALQRTAAPHAPPAAIIRSLDNGAIGLAFVRRGHLLAVVDNSDYGPAVRKPPSIKLFSVADPAHPHLVATLRGNTYSVAVSPGGRLLTGYAAGQVLVWDISDPRRPVRLPAIPLAASSYVTGGAFSPGGRLLAVGDSSGTLQLWQVSHDRPGRRPLADLTQSSGQSELAFSPDGRTLAAPGQLNGNNGSATAVALWDVSAPRSPRLEAQWPVHAGLTGPAGLAFSPRGHTLVVAGSSAVTLWSTDPAEVTASLCATVGDPISPAEWRQYVPNLPYRPPCGAAPARSRRPSFSNVSS